MVIERRRLNRRFLLGPGLLAILNLITGWLPKQMRYQTALLPERDALSSIWHLFLPEFCSIFTQIHPFAHIFTNEGGEKHGKIFCLFFRQPRLLKAGEVQVLIGLFFARLERVISTQLHQISQRRTGGRNGIRCHG